MLEVLVLHSYHPGFTWTDSLQKGIDAFFEDSGKKAEIHVEYMDAKHYPDSLLFETLAGLYKKKYAKFPPDIIISCDDDALIFLFQYRNTIFPGVPVVFSGLNVEDFDPEILAGKKGYTGVVERLDLASTIDLILSVHPGVRKIAFIHDRTTSGLKDRNTILSLQPGYQSRVQFVFPDKGKGITEKELLTYLNNLKPDTMVYFLGFFRDKNELPLAMDEIIPAISKASPVPVYSHADAYLGFGIIGGKLLCAEVHGKSAAYQALQVLDAASADDVPVLVESSNRFMFDYRQLKRFQIPVSRLPEKSRILFLPASFRQRYKTEIRWAAAGVLSLFLLTLFLGMHSVYRRRTEQQIKKSEKKYRLLADNATDMISRHDLRGIYTYVSPSSSSVIGYSQEALIGKSAYAFVHPDDIPFVRKYHDAILEEQKPQPVAYRIRSGPGKNKALLQKHNTGPDAFLSGEENQFIWMETTGKIIRNAKTGVSHCILAISRDISQRKHAEETLRANEEKYHTLFTEMAQGAFYQNPEGYIFEINPAALDIFGISEEECKSRTSADPGWVVLDKDGDPLPRESLPSIKALTTGKAVKDQTLQVYNPLKKKYIWVNVNAVPRFLQDGKKPFQVFVTMHDITALKEAETKIKEQAAQLELAQELARIGYWHFHIDTQVPEWSPMMFTVLGCDPEKGVPDYLEHKEFIHPDDWEMFDNAVQKAVSGTPYHLELKIVFPDKSIRHVVTQGHPLLDEKGNVSALFGITQDITLRKHAELLLTESEEKFRMLFHRSPAAMTLVKMETGEITDINYHFLQWLGLEKTDCLNKNFQELGLFPNEEVEMLVSGFENDEINGLETDILAKDGTKRTCLIYARMITISQQSQILTTYVDVTEQRHLEARLRRSYKMEAIGTISAGIAHEFNNILAIILGNAELAQYGLSKELLQEIIEASLRGKDIVERLLSFSKAPNQKSTPVVLSSLVEEAMFLLKTTLPENIELELSFSGDCRPVMGNHSQLQQMIINLVANAVDAIGEKKGKITMVVDNHFFSREEIFFDKTLSPGHYVRLLVKDTGTGIPMEILDRVFDPFFTTKEFGKGTGMGLSVVQGVVKAHGAGIRIQSIPENGTIIESCFPAAEKKAAPTPARAWAFTF